MTDQIAFELIVWRPIYHNDKFSHNVVRRVVSRNPSVPLQSEETTTVYDGLTITACDEYVKSMRRGRIVYREEFVPDE